MSLPIKLICKKSKVRKDGTSIIFIQYCYSSDKRTLLDTGVAVPPAYWNKKTLRISKELPQIYGEPEQLDFLLSEKVRKAEDMIRFALKYNVNPLELLKKNFHLDNNVPTNVEPVAKKVQVELDVFENIDDYIKSKEGKVRTNTIEVLNAMKQHLKRYEEHIKKPIIFESFDMLFYESFVKFLTYEITHIRRKTVIKGFKTNTVGKTIKHLKSFLRDRMQKKIIPFIDISGFKGMEENVDAVFLNWKEISNIYHLDLSTHPHLEKYRDLFVVGCLTGFRFSDYSEIVPEEIRNGMLYVYQQKTNSKVVVPLRLEAKKLLVEKYNMRMPVVSNPDFNYYIKEVAKLAGIDEKIIIAHKQGNRMVEEIKPKYAWVTSHTCRRSFCTNEFLDGTPVNLIMAISGHKTEKAFRRYIKAEQEQKAQLIKTIWDKKQHCL